MRTHNALARDQEIAITVIVGHGRNSDAVTLTDLSGRNWVTGVTIRQNIDQAVADCELHLWKDDYETSLAPLMGNSTLNSVDQPLTIGHKVFIDVTDSSGAHEIFRGRIDDVDVSGPTIVVRARDLAGDLHDCWSEVPRWYALGRQPRGVRLWEAGETVANGEYIGPDKPADTGATVIYQVVNAGGAFADTPPEPWPTDYNTFSNGAVQLQRVAIGVSVWLDTTAYTWGDVVISTEDGDKRAICTQAGTTGDTEPAWPTAGLQVNDGTARWAVLPANSDGGLALEAAMNAVIRDNYSTGAPDLYTPTKSNYFKNPTIIQEASTLETLRNFAGEVGWDVRMAYVSTVTKHEIVNGNDDGWGYWRLQLYEPDRTKSVADATFSADDVYSVQRCSQSLVGIRNAVQVAYDDFDSFNFDGVTNRRRYVKVSDSASIAKYGRRFFGLSCGTGNSISTATEATALANAILADLKDPELEWTVTTPLCWWLEINDYLSFSANSFNSHFSSEQRLAVIGLTHEVRISGNNELTAHTTIQTRGKPTAGIKGWLGREQGPGRGQPGRGAQPAGPGSITVTDTVKGGIVTFKRPRTDTRRPKAGYGSNTSGDFAEAQLYLSETQGFTPSSSNLRAISKSDSFELTGLTAKVTQYGRIVIKDSMGRQSAPSAEFEVAPTQMDLATIDDTLKVSCAIGDGRTSPSTWFELSDLVNSTYGFVFPTDIYNDGSGYDTSTGVFTAPAAGVYRFHAHVSVRNKTSIPDPIVYDDYGRMTGGLTTYLGLYVNGVARSGAKGLPQYIAPQDVVGLALDTIVVLSADDEVGLFIYGSTGVSLEYNAPSALLTIDRVWSR